MASLNIASLPRHIDELRIWITNQNLDLLCINETRLDGIIPNESIQIPNYEIIRNDRNRNGGGVCIYVRSTVNYVDKSGIIPNEMEAACIKINKPQSKSFVVISCYRPPNADAKNFFEKLQSIVTTLDSNNKEVYIFVDLNCNMLSLNDNLPKNELNSLCELYQLQQLITEPTKITMDSRTLIVIILTNTQYRIVSRGVLHLSIGDHSLIFAIRKISVSNRKAHTITKVRNLKNFVSTILKTT